MRIKTQNDEKGWGGQKQWMLIVAAALAATGDYTAEMSPDRGGGVMELPARFEAGASLTETGRLKTRNDYQVRLDRVEIDPDQLAMVVGKRAAATCVQGELGELMEAGAGELVCQGGAEGDVSITLTGAQLQGRVFDARGRLPQEGVKISGTLPVEVRIRAEKRLDLWNPGASETVMAVDFEIPTDYFEQVDWQVLVAPEAMG